MIRRRRKKVRRVHKRRIIQAKQFGQELRLIACHAGQKVGSFFRVSVKNRRLRVKRNVSL
jgi:hypothetical protein